MTTALEAWEALLIRLTRAEKAQVLQCTARDLGDARLPDTPVRRWPRRTDAGSSCPLRSFSNGW